MHSTRLLLPLLLAGALSALVPVTPASAIVGGTRAKPSAYPWFAELPFCGGALIAPDRIATAAHCVAGLPLRDVGEIRLGNGASPPRERHIGPARLRAPRARRLGQPRCAGR